MTCSEEIENKTFSTHNPSYILGLEYIRLFLLKSVPPRYIIVIVMRKGRKEEINAKQYTKKENI